MNEDKLPTGIHNAFLFQALNAVSFNIALGSPLILFARDLGASASVIGLLGGLTALLSTLQLVAVPLGERWGWRNLMLRGWSGRVGTLLFLATIPLTVSLVPPVVSVAMLVGCMVVFNAIRGFAAGAWIPMIASVVPRAIRGRYLTIDRAFQAVAAVLSFALTGTLLSLNLGLVTFAIVFGLSFASGAASLYFLNRVPYVLPTREAMVENANVGFADVLKDGPFMRLITYSFLVQIVFAATTPFAIVFSGNVLGVPSEALVWLSAASSVLGMLALAVMRRRVDVRGSKPLLRYAFIWWVVLFVLWTVLAVARPAFGAPLAVAILAIHGFFAAIYDLAATRLLMNMAYDRNGSARFLTLQSVIVNLGGGLAPILWGLAIDSLGRVTTNPFGWFFAAQLAIVGVAGFTLWRLREPVMDNRH